MGSSVDVHDELALHTTPDGKVGWCGHSDQTRASVVKDVRRAAERAERRARLLRHYENVLEDAGTLERLSRTIAYWNPDTAEGGEVER